MAERDKELIDLNKLSMRELLIVVAKEQKKVEADVKQIRQDLDEMRIKVNTLDTKGKIIGGLAGFFAAIAAMIAERFLK